MKGLGSEIGFLVFCSERLFFGLGFLETSFRAKVRSFPSPVTVK